MTYSTYLGGSGQDLGRGIAVDSAGNAYVTGYTASTNFPTVSPLQGTYGGGSHDVFVAKLNATGSALVYATYFGGSAHEEGADIAVDAAGNAYIAGGTGSTNFPTTPGAFQTVFAGGYDAFVTKLNAAGNGLVYSTYLGGSGGSGPLCCAGSDDAYGIAVDASGSAYVVGITDSNNFPTTPGAFRTAPFGGGSDGFITKINATGAALVYSAYIGDQALGVAVDTAGNAYVTGTTGGTLPIVNALQPSSGGGVNDAFVTKLNAAGSALVYSTYLGGSGEDGGRNIAVDASGNAYLTGFTTSTNFPTGSPFQATLGGGQDAFVVKLNAAGSALVYSTYLGGSGEDDGNGIAVDASGNAYLTGYTTSTNFPTGSPFQATLGGGQDAFVVKLNAAGSALVYSTYLGGSGNDGGMSIAVDASGNAYLTGYTTSTNFPTGSPFQATLGGGQDAFVAKIGTLPPISSFSATPDSGDAPVSVAFEVVVSDPDWVIASVEWDFDGNGTVDQTTTGLTTSFTYTTAGTFTPEVTVVDDAGATASATTTVTVTNLPPETTITSAPPALSNSASASFSFTANEAGSTFACQLDGSGFAACSSPKSYGGLADGGHTFQVRATDPAGNPDPTPDSFTWTVDTTPPDTAMTAQPPTLTNSASASFSFSATEAGSSFACSLDGGGFVACGSPQSYSGLADGSHTFQVRAIDPAGNPDPTPDSFIWTVDTTPPDTAMTAQPPTLTNSPSASFSFSATEAGSSFACSLDGAAFVACGGTQTFPGLADGVHTLQVRATDTAGNLDATAATYTWTVDTTLPDVTITSPGIDDVLTVSPVTVTVLANDTVGVASVSANSVAATLVAGTAQSGTWQAAVPVTVGSALTFTATATDQATNIASATTVVDNDGIAATIDTDSASFSNDFSDMASGGTTTGTITTRGGWTVRVVEVSPGGVQVSLAGAGATARVATCAAGGAESVELDGAGETATITCVNTTGSNTGSRVTADLATAPTTNPKIIVRNASNAIRARLSTGQTATVGSPITADPANTEPVLVELVDSFDVPYGSFALDAAESVDVNVTSSNTVEVTVLVGTTTLTIAGQTTTLSAGQAQTFGSVAIDIKPGSTPNSINPRSQGKIPVAILSHATLEAPTHVDRTSLTFGRTGDEHSLAFCEPDGLQDVNGDGRLDLVCHFHTPAAGFQAGDTQGILKGKTRAGVSFTGLDAVRIVPAR